MSQSLIKKESSFEKNNLPSGWIKTKLENMCTIILGQSPLSSTYNSLGNGIPFFQGKSDFGDLYPKTRVWCSSPKKIAKKNDLLLSVRAPVGSTNLSSEQCCIGRGLAAIRPIDKNINVKFFIHFFTHIEDYLDSKGTGTTFKAISGKQIRELIIPLPPLNEQKRIVLKIESIFAQIDAAKEILIRLQGTMQSRHTSLASLKSSVLKQAFEGRLVPQDPDDESAEDFLHKIHKNSKKELIFEEDNMPRRWIKTSLDSVSNIILGQSPPSSTYNSLKAGLPFFQGKADFGVLHPKTRVWCSSPKKIAEKNDLLLSVRAPVGSTNLSKERCCIGRGLAAIRSINCDMPTMFFVYFFKYIESYLENQGTGTTFKAISGKQIRDLRIPLPPLNEQKRIVSKIESIFGNIDTLNLFYFILLGNLFTNLRYFIILYMPHAISDQ